MNESDKDTTKNKNEVYYEYKRVERRSLNKISARKYRSNKILGKNKLIRDLYTVTEKYKVGKKQLEKMKRVYQRNASMVNKVLESQSKSEALVDLDKYFSELEHKKLDGLHYIPNASSSDLNGEKIASNCFREGDGGKDDKCMTRCAALFDCLLVTFEQVRSDLEKSIVEIENTAL